MEAHGPYRASIRKIDTLIDQGVSMSGNEPNCAFLNLRDGTFATASAVSGFDFPDDARSLGLMDWDGDGGIDVWMTNRSAPMVRFLRNEAPRGHFLRLRLEGTGANRDAVGARVEVRLKNDPDRPLIRSVKAGEGYLGQSSRWLHFGLGENPEIERVRVIWPGGREEKVAGCKPDTALTFTEGDPFAQIFAAAGGKPMAAGGPAPLTGKKAELAGAVALLNPQPFPTLPAVDLNGKEWTVTDKNGPLLINLWATWCAPCVAELTKWRDSAAMIEKAGFDIALLSADGRDDLHRTGPADAAKWLKARKIDFPAGSLTDEAYRRLTSIHRSIFGPNVTLPVPTSFLLDGNGRIAAIYRGPVEIGRVWEDAAALKDPRRASKVLPYPGRWQQAPGEPDPTAPLADLVAHTAWDDAVAYFQRHRPMLERHRDFAGVAAALASKLEGANRPAEAIGIYEIALAKSPQSLDVLNNLAYLLAGGAAADAGQPPPAFAQPPRALLLAEQAVALTQRKNPAILDTLATAQAANGQRDKALATVIEALALARQAGPAAAALIPALEKSAARYRTGK